MKTVALGFLSISIAIPFIYTFYNIFPEASNAFTCFFSLSIPLALGILTDND